MPSPKPLAFRAPARADVEAAVDWYTREGGEEVAARFVADLEAAYARIGSSPGAGSPHWGDVLRLPGLRHRPLKRFPYLVFFIERAERIEIVRMLHGSRDIPATLAGPEAE